MPTLAWLTQEVYAGGGGEKNWRSLGMSRREETWQHSKRLGGELGAEFQKAGLLSCQCLVISQGEGREGPILIVPELGGG